MKNLHKAYYKDYFKGIDFNYLLLEEEIKRERNENRKRELRRELERIEGDNEIKIKRKNSALLGTGLLSLINNPIASQEHRFSLKIAYPGLVTGVGIDHEAKIEGEFKLGVHFDYTWGMPVVYGSSVKGVLRAYFKEFYQNGNDSSGAEYMFNDIFEGRDMAKEHRLNDGNKYYKSIYNRDIFFDAVITGTDSESRILCSDSITPHGDNPLKNPVPLTFLKIAAGCTMEFRFKLVDTKDENGNVIFTKEDKKAIFQEILQTVGVGAKTNVGYGQFQ